MGSERYKKIVNWHGDYIIYYFNIFGSLIRRRYLHYESLTNSTRNRFDRICVTDAWTPVRNKNHRATIHRDVPISHKQLHTMMLVYHSGLRTRSGYDLIRLYRSPRPNLNGVYTIISEERRTYDPVDGIYGTIYRSFPDQEVSPLPPYDHRRPDETYDQARDRILNELVLIWER